MKDKTLRVILAFFLIISAVLVAVAVHAVQNINRATRDADWVNHTHSIIAQIDALDTALYAAEATAQAYVGGGQSSDLAASNRALARINEHVEIMTALTQQEEAQQRQVLEIAALITPHVSGLREILALRQADRGREAQARLTAIVSGADIPELELKINQLKEDVLGLLSERDTAVYLQAEKTRWTVWSGVVLDVILLGGMVWLICDDLKARRKVATALQLANDQLEERVQARTAELAETNRQLTTENLERQWTNQALEHQLHYNHNIVDSISDSVLVLTKAANISRVNPAVLHLTGCDSSDLINQPLARVLQSTSPEPEASKRLHQQIAQAMKEGRDLRDQAGAVSNRQHRTQVRFSLFPLRDQNKVIGGIVTLQIVPPGSEAKV